MATADIFDAIEHLKRDVQEQLLRFTRIHKDAEYAELRFEVIAHRSGAATDGEPRDSSESESASCSIAVHVRDRSGAIGHGQTGAEVGALATRRAKLAAVVRGGLDEAYERARASAREKGAMIAAMGREARALQTRATVAAEPIRADIAAVFRRDPRTIAIDELKRLALDASHAVSALGAEIAFNAVSAMTEMRQELFANTTGSLITQAFAFSQGDSYVVAQSAGGHQENYDTIGQQCGFECLEEGWRGELMPNPDLRTFAIELASEARELAAAPVLKPPAGEVVVVTDPHFNALVAHEIVGHPSEADRALKMEAAYAGRSWFLRSLADNEIGRMVASPLLSACSDPSLDGYGHYRYDHEGTPGRRVMHFERGRFAGFLNSRATAAILDAEPNGSARASEGWHLPLIRMSNTFFMPGETPPEKIIADVEHGYYVCGHQIPSIAESRENFRISARRVYEIDHGRIGRLYRSGSVIADSRRFFMNVDAVGDDLSLIAIPNCGKGQPMQVKRMSNGGPTLRSRARLGGG
ncbi:MAG TPA: TldD/PmbA family protein [Candidatus Binataceae bacterium]|nr:TldD/PmbA family protein [Candidatus Binataceae bacterium]